MRILRTSGILHEIKAPDLKYLEERLSILTVKGWQVPEWVMELIKFRPFRGK